MFSRAIPPTCWGSTWRLSTWRPLPAPTVTILQSRFAGWKNTLRTSIQEWQFYGSHAIFIFVTTIRLNHGWTIVQYILRMIFEKAFGIYNTFKNHGWGKNGKRKKRKVKSEWKKGKHKGLLIFPPEYHWISSQKSLCWLHTLEKSWNTVKEWKRGFSVEGSS